MILPTTKLSPALHSAHICQLMQCSLIWLSSMARNSKLHSQSAAPLLSNSKSMCQSSSSRWRNWLTPAAWNSSAKPTPTRSLRLKIPMSLWHRWRTTTRRFSNSLASTQWCSATLSLSTTTTSLLWFRIWASRAWLPKAQSTFWVGSRLTTFILRLWHQSWSCCWRTLNWATTFRSASATPTGHHIRSQPTSISTGLHRFQKKNNSSTSLWTTRPSAKCSHAKAASSSLWRRCLASLPKGASSSSPQAK